MFKLADYTGLKLSSEPINTNNLLLDVPNIKYTNDLFGIISDKEVNANLKWSLDSAEKVKSHIDDMIYRGDVGKLAVWVIVDKSSGKAIGSIKITPTSNDEFEIGYYLNKNFWGKGFTTEAVSAVKDFAKLKGINSISAETDIDNIASIKVLLNSGFKEVKDNKTNGGEQNKKSIRFRF